MPEQEEIKQTNPVGADVLLTGATGFLGKVVLYELLRRRESLGVEKVRVLIRGNGSGTAASRFDTDVAGKPCFTGLDPDWRNYAEPVDCDLSAPGAGIADVQRESLANSVTHIINCAASVQFELPIQDAAQANVTTALEMLKLAQSCRSLSRFVNVSTAYVTPHRDDGRPVAEELAPLPHDASDLYEGILRGEIDEAKLLAETGHPNTYTLTKCIAEHLLCERKGDAPLALVRPSVIASSLRQPFPGWIDSPAAFALFAANIGAGRMHVVVGRPNSRLDVIPCDAVADRLIDAAFKPVRMNGSPATPILHAVAGPDNSPDIRTCVSAMEKYFQRNPDTRKVSRDLYASVRYVGPDGPLYRLNHWLHHERSATSRRIPEGMANANRMFAYFTHNTFEFQSSAPFDPPGFDSSDYVTTVCKGVAQYLMGADNTAVPIAGGMFPKARKDLKWALTQERGNLFVRGAAYQVVKTLRDCMDCVTFDLESFQAAVEDVPAGAHIVLVPSHRSYLDFVLCSVLMFARPDLGIAIPHIAATSDFGRIPLLSWLFLRLHAFYIQRGLGREDTRLTDKVRALIKSGRVIEFFIEGTRSRTRQFLRPRRGLLRSLQATGETFAVLPVAFSYERLPEEGAFTVELNGDPRPPMQLRKLLRWNKRARGGEINLGRAHIACGRPVVYGPESDVHEVARKVMEELQRGTVTTKYHLQAFLDREQDALHDIELPWLVEQIERRGGRVLGTHLIDDGVPPLHERCMRYQYEHLFYAEAERAFAGNPAIENHIRSNRYGEFAPPGPESGWQGPRQLQFLRALFGAVVSDYQAVVASLGAPGAELMANSPRAVLRAHDELHIPDVEGAFEDLTERGILAYNEERREYSWGPEASGLAAYKECLDRFW